MALFKISKGSSDKLHNQNLVEGYAWFTPDDGKFYIDADRNGNGVLERIPLSSVFMFDVVDKNGDGTTTANSAGFYLYADSVTFTDIINAFGDNLTVCAKYYKYNTAGNYILMPLIAKPDSNNVFFGASHGGVSYQIWCDNNNVWHFNQTNLLTEEDSSSIQLITWESGDDGSVQGDN